MTDGPGPEELLAGIDLFAGLSKRERKRLVSRGHEVSHPDGRQVATEGGAAHAFHLILAGRATVSQDAGVIRTLGVGDYFGEISMIDNKPRSATVTAEENLRTLAIDHGVFEALLDDQPELARGLLKVLCARLREAEAR